MITTRLTADVPGPSSTTGTGTTTGPPIDGVGLGLFLAVLALLALALIVTPWVLSVATDSQREPLLKAPFMTWFLLHYAVAIVGVLAVVALAVTRVLNETGVSALLGSLFGYVLGTAKSDRGSGSGTAAPTAAPARPTITKIDPASAPAGTKVTITGSGFPIKGTVTVTLGGLVAPNVKVVDATTITADAPSGTASGTAVTVGFGDGLSLTRRPSPFTRT